MECIREVQRRLPRLLRSEVSFKISFSYGFVLQRVKRIISFDLMIIFLSRDMSLDENSEYIYLKTMTG